MAATFQRTWPNLFRASTLKWPAVRLTFGAFLR